MAWSWVFRYALWNAIWVFSQHGAVVQSAAYLKALEVARSSPEVQRVIGQPMDTPRLALGEIRRGYGTEFTEWSVQLRGPKGSGRLSAVANRLGDSWDYSRLAFMSADGQTAVDLTPPPRRDSLKLADEVRSVYLVALDASAAQMLQWAPRYYKLKLGLDVTILPSISLDSSVTDAKRKQIVAEQAIDAMRKARPDVANDSSAVFIGVTSHDMFIRGYDWDYATNLRQRRFAVISTARLQPFSDLGKWNQQLLFFLLLQTRNPELMPSRLQKLLSKNIYALSFDLPLSNDSTSLIGAGVRTGSDVDWMGSSVIGAEGRWDSFVSWGDPEISLVTESGKPPIWRFDAAGDPPDTSSESFVADLRNGLFVERKTDFILKDDFPIYLARAYRNQDNQSRAFGIGTNDTLDIFLIGQMGSYIDLIMDDGARIHFVRDLRTPGQFYRPEGQTTGSTLVYEGDTWRLTTEDGSVYLFPYRPKAYQGQVTVLTGYTDSGGHRYDMQRDEAGDLLKVETPSGKWLQFVHDPQHRITQVADSSGRTLRYEYDAGGRLGRVTDNHGASESYRYDEQNQLTAVLDSNEGALLTNSYSPDGFIALQILSDGRRFEYVYRRNTGTLVQTVVTDPEGYVTHFDFTPDKYAQSLPIRPEEGLKQ
jgi:YD repeat-containing protein